MTPRLFLINAIPASWLERTDENKTVFPSFHQDIQHPVNAVIEINVGRPSMISLDERATLGRTKQ